MPIEILMPELGESVHEGTISRWLKKEGEYVQEDEPVVEIMTDKVNTELPAPASGILTKILIPEGGAVAVFTAMGIIDDAASAGTSVVASPGPSEPKEVETPETPADGEAASGAGTLPVGGGKWFSPVVRAMARQHGLSEAELSGLVGSGAGGRVTKKDVEAYLAERKASEKPSMAAAAQVPAPSAPAPQSAPGVAGPDQELIPLVGMRKMIADAMVRSAAVPTVSTVIQVDVTSLVKFREANKEVFQAQHGVKLTYTPFFIKALTEALMEFPMVNASLQPDNQILMTKGVHMGVAVALGAKGDEGLIVPVIRDCDKKSIGELAKDLDQIASKARNNQLQVTDVQGGTFTLTNPGSYGALFGTPMINAPQAAIAGVYGIEKLPVIVDDMIAVRSMMYMVLTYDHRIIDGLLAGRFLQSVKERLETFDFFK